MFRRPLQTIPNNAKGFKPIVSSSLPVIGPNIPITNEPGSNNSPESSL